MYGFVDCIICDKSFDAKCNPRAHKKMHTNSLNVRLERIPHLVNVGLGRIPHLVNVGLGRIPHLVNVGLKRIPLVGNVGLGKIPHLVNKRWRLFTV